MSIINAFVQEVALRYGTFELNLSNPLVLLGLMIGSVLPFLLSAHTLRAVGRTATLIVEEIRRQFREIPVRIRCADARNRSWRSRATR